jgi:hypothetical protein
MTEQPDTVILSAKDILAAIHQKHTGAAIVHEVVLDDPNWLDTFEPGEGIGSFRRIDALMIKGKIRTAIEVKISRSDYFRETPRKRQVWQDFCHRFVYAVPAGLIQPHEVPDGIGLWEVALQPSANGWQGVTVTKRARVNREASAVPEQLFVAMCYRAMRNQLADEIERAQDA